MRADPDKILEAGELDWALGELLQLISEGKRVGVMAHELDPRLFQTCMTVINWQPFEVRERAHRIIVATEYWRVSRFRYAFA